MKHGVDDEIIETFLLALSVAQNNTRDEQVGFFACCKLVISKRPKLQQKKTKKNIKNNSGQLIAK